MAESKNNAGKNSNKGAAKKRSAKCRLMSFLFKWSLTAAIWCIVLVSTLVAYYAYDLPSVDSALEVIRRPSVTILAKDGTRLARSGGVQGKTVQVGEVPAYLPQAVIATEDRRFYHHSGIDIIAIARAMIINIQAGRIVQGGSTISQQAAKNLFLSPARTLRRKVQELLLAFWLEQKFTKDQILTIYLNRVYLGAGTYGIEAAARKFFDRSARHISLYQAAVLAGLLKAPSRLNPARNPRAAAKRARVVLANMVGAGYLTKAQAAKAQKATQRLARRRPTPRIGRHFADWIIDHLPGFIGPLAGDIVVKTTLDSRLQKWGELVVGKVLKRSADKMNADQAGLLVMTPDGAIRAMVGGRNYARSQFNRATQARRQPGSAFKPVVYLAGLESGMTPETMVMDAPVNINGWRPRNYNGTYQGQMTLRQALSRSINTVAVRVSERAGLGRVIDTAHRLGITATLPATPSLALGTAEISLLEMTSAYAVFANGGKGVWAYGVEEIIDRQGRSLYRRSGDGPATIVDAAAIAKLNDMLSEVLRTGTGKSARLTDPPRPAAGKTGTSQEFRDAWFVGYSAQLVGGVWVGNDNGEPMKNVTGGGLPAEIWRGVMTAAHRGLPVRNLPGTDSTGRVSEPSFWQRLFGG